MVDRAETVNPAFKERRNKMTKNTNKSICMKQHSVALANSRKMRFVSRLNAIELVLSVSVVQDVAKAE